MVSLFWSIHYIKCIWGCSLSLTRSKLRLCSANHRPGYWSNLPCDWPSTAWAYSHKRQKTGPENVVSWMAAIFYFSRLRCVECRSVFHWDCLFHPGHNAPGRPTMKAIRKNKLNWEGVVASMKLIICVRKIQVHLVFWEDAFESGIDKIWAIIFRAQPIVA